MGMSQHLANALYRNIIAQANLGGKSMAGIVVSQMLVEVTLFLNHLECLTNAGSRRNKEHVPFLAFALYFSMIRRGMSSRGMTQSVSVF